MNLPSLTSNHQMLYFWKAGALRISNMILRGDYMVTTWLLLGDHLATTWRPLGNHLATTWWLLGDHLATTWWLLGLKLPTLGTSPIIKVMDMNIRKYFYSLFRIPQNFFANLFHVLCAFLIINITTGTESHNNVIKEDFSFRLGWESDFVFEHCSCSGSNWASVRLPPWWKIWQERTAW